MDKQLTPEGVIADNIKSTVQAMQRQRELYTQQFNRIDEVRRLLAQHREVEAALRESYERYQDQAYNPPPHTGETMPRNEPVLREELSPEQERQMTNDKRVDPDAFTTVGGIDAHRGGTVSETVSVGALMKQQSRDIPSGGWGDAAAGTANAASQSPAYTLRRAGQMVYGNTSVDEVLENRIQRAKGELDRLEMLRVKFAAAKDLTKDDFLALFGPV